MGALPEQHSRRPAENPEKPGKPGKPGKPPKAPETALKTARRTRMVLAASGAAALMLTAAACSSGGSGANGSQSGSGGAKTEGGTASYALPPNVTPNYIFPFVNATYDLIQNLDYFQYLMYRPLYWFGNGTSPTLNTNLSLADPPKYDGTKVTITMKPWKWSNGESITAQDVVFWIHMMQAVGQTDWGPFVPGGFPTNVSDVTAVSPTELTMTMNKQYNTTWFTYNELSQISPMPKAWDRTASGPTNCRTNVNDCAAVYSYLDSQSKAMTSWAFSPLWSVVDGPWKLQTFNSDGHATFVPNKSYSGPVKPSLAEFKELPYTTDSAEYNVLQAGGNQIDVGYLPSQDAPAKPAGQNVGTNPVTGYTLDPLYLWSINYFPVNFQSTTGNGPVLKQLYIRQALQYLVNQAAVISGPLRGYGFPTVGPVPTYPANTYLSPTGKEGDQFPFNPVKAKELLASNGWKVVPNGVSTCETPAKCGAGVKQGQGLQFNLPYANGTTWIEQMVSQLQSNASLVGIKLNTQPKLFNDVTAIGAPNCVVAHTSCGWDMALWGGGWSFAPDYYPTGETLFTSGSASNSGGFSDSQNDSLINQTLTSNSTGSLVKWQDYLTQKLPFIWIPNGAYSLTEVVSNLQGVIPQSTTGVINPENWYFTK